jgi:ferredoxin-NADP reductase
LRKNYCTPALQSETSGEITPPEILTPTTLGENVVAKLVYSRLETVDTKHLSFEIKKPFSFFSGQWADFFLPKKLENINPQNATSFHEILTNQRHQIEGFNIAGFSMSCSPRWSVNSNRLTFAVKKSNNPVVQYLFNAEPGSHIIMSSSGQGNMYYSRERFPKKKSVVLIGGISRISSTCCYQLQILGGIGITPLMSILGHIYDSENGVEAILLHSTLTKQGQYFRDVIQYMSKYKRAIKPYWTVTDLDPLKRSHAFLYTKGFKRIGWNDFLGKINRGMIERLKLDLPNSVFFLCGPLPMLHDIKSILLGMGVPEEDILHEQWAKNSSPDQVVIKME